MRVNLKRGFYRVWVVVSGLWLLLVVGVFVDEFVLGKPFAGPYTYVHVMTKDATREEMDKLSYDLFVPPLQTGQEPEFSSLGWQYESKWREDVKEGSTVIVDFPDRSELFLPSHFSKSERTYLSKSFWNQRWGRYFDKFWPWIAYGLCLPIGLLLLGYVTAWTAAGFKRG